MRRETHTLTMSWVDNVLAVTGPNLPVPHICITYIEAFCRPGSHDRDWSETVIPHRTTLLSGDAAGRHLELESELDDGVIVRHSISATEDEIDLRLHAHNPTACESEAHWAQPCIRVGAFTGMEEAPDPDDYLPKCFVFISESPAPMPTPGWSTSARNGAGQVWHPASVSPEDVNPRPINPMTPSNGLIGCFSADERMILATAWEPYHELFQGIFQCIHSDFRIGGLRPGEHKSVRGKLYIVRNDMNALLERYRRDFPEHGSGEPAGAGDA